MPFLIFTENGILSLIKLTYYESFQSINMIQRLQTLYLLIVIILSVVSLCSTIGVYNAGGEPIAEFSNFTFSTLSEPFTQMQASGPWALGVILIAVIAIAAFTIVIFHKRVLQMRLTIFTMLLLIGYILAYVFYAWVYQQKLNEIQAAFQPEFQLRLNTVYPLVSVILCFLAFRGIRRDEKLIRSLERIR